VISTQKQPECKKHAALFKMATVKSCAIKGGGQEMAVIIIVILLYHILYNCKTHIVSVKQCQNKLANESTEAILPLWLLTGGSTCMGMVLGEKLCL